MSRYRIACALAIGATLVSAASASAQSTPSFPVYPTDKWLGNVNELTRPLFPQYFNQVTPENARQVGECRGHEPHRGHALGQSGLGVHLRADQRHEVQLPRARLG